MPSIFRPDTSFPFLAIARRRNVRYSTVLHYADMIEAGYVAGVNIWTPNHDLFEEVGLAVEAERERRRLNTFLDGACITRGQAPG